MALFPGWQAPDFMIDTTTGPIRFHAWAQGCWRIVMTHPADYSPHSLRLALQRIHASGAEIDLLGLSPFHMAGAKPGIVAHPGAAELAHLATVTDDTRRIRALWQGIAVDAGQDGNAAVDEHVVFIVDPANRIHSTIIYPPVPGRDFDEILRVMPEPEPARHAA